MPCMSKNLTRYRRTSLNTGISLFLVSRYCSIKKISSFYSFVAFKTGHTLYISCCNRCMAYPAFEPASWTDCEIHVSEPSRTKPSITHQCPLSSWQTLPPYPNQRYVYQVHPLKPSTPVHLDTLADLATTTRNNH